jgi:hypothetical protein
MTRIGGGVEMRPAQNELPNCSNFSAAPDPDLFPPTLSEMLRMVGGALLMKNANVHVN